MVVVGARTDVAQNVRESTAWLLEGLASSRSDGTRTIPGSFEYFVKMFMSHFIDIPDLDLRTPEIDYGEAKECPRFNFGLYK